MDALTRFLTTAGRGGALPALSRRLLQRVSGFVQALTTTETVSAFLDDPDVTVPYHERSELLGVGDFPLALDGKAHGAARKLIADVLDSSAKAREDGVTAAAALTGRQMATASDRLDLIEQVVDPALEAWVETWYGLPDWGCKLMRAGRLILHATFLNPKQPKGHTDFGALRRAIDTVDCIRFDLADHLGKTDPLPDRSVAAELVSRTDPQVGAQHLLGLTVGPLALGSQSMAHVLDELLGCSWKLADLTTRPGENVAGARLRAEGLFGATLARRPPLPGVARHCPVGRGVAGTDDRCVWVPRGDMLVATQAAMTLDPRASALVFGHGAHACMGRSQITEVAGAVLVAVASRSPRRIPGAAGKLTNGEAPTDFADWPFPGHLDVSLLA